MPCRVLPKLQRLPRKSPRTGETNAVAQARGQRKISTAVEFDAPRSTIADSGGAEPAYALLREPSDLRNTRSNMTTGDSLLAVLAERTAFARCEGDAVSVFAGTHDVVGWIVVLSL